MFRYLTFGARARVLEVGCGYGDFAAWAANQARLGSVLAVDIDPFMITSAKKRFPKETYANLDFQQADARTLAFEAQPFDYVISNACLHYLEHPGQAFLAIASHLKPGGKFCMACLGQGNLITLHRVLGTLMSSPQWKEYFVNFKLTALADPASCEPWLKNAGLRKERAQLLNEAISFPDQQNFQGWLNSNFGHYIQMLPSDQERFRFSDEVCEEYCRRFNGKAVKAFRVWLQLEATKVD